MTYIPLGIKLSTHISYLSKYKMFMLKKYKNKNVNTLLLLSLLSNINFYIIHNYYYFFFIQNPMLPKIIPHFNIHSYHLLLLYRSNNLYGRDGCLRLFWYYVILFYVNFQYCYLHVTCIAFIQRMIKPYNLEEHAMTLCDVQYLRKILLSSAIDNNIISCI